MKLVVMHFKVRPISMVVYFPLAKLVAQLPAGTQAKMDMISSLLERMF